MCARRLFCQIEKEHQCFIADAIFRIVQVDASGLGSHPLSASGIIREEVSQMDVTHFPLMIFKGLPCRALACRPYVECFLEHWRDLFFVAAKETHLCASRGMAASHPTAEIHPGRHWRLQVAGFSFAKLSIETVFTELTGFFQNRRFGRDHAHEFI